MALPLFIVTLINHNTAQRTEITISAGNAAAAMRMAQVMFPMLSPQAARPVK